MDVGIRQILEMRNDESVENDAASRRIFEPNTEYCVLWAHVAKETFDIVLKFANSSSFLSSRSLTSDSLRADMGDDIL